MMSWFREWRERSTRARLLSLIDFQSRLLSQMQADVRELVIHQQDVTAHLADQFAEMAKGIADATRANQEAFSSFLTYITPKGDTQIRVMNDATESKLEEELAKDQREYAFAKQTIVDDPLLDSVQAEHAMGADLAQLIRELSSQPPSLP